MQAPCSCKRKCLAKIDDNRRKGIHSQFWSLSKPLRDETKLEVEGNLMISMIMLRVLMMLAMLLKCSQVIFWT